MRIFQLLHVIQSNLIELLDHQPSSYSLFRAVDPRQISRKSDYRSLINIIAIWRHAKRVHIMLLYVCLCAHSMGDRAVHCSFSRLRTNNRSRHGWAIQLGVYRAALKSNFRISFTYHKSKTKRNHVSSCPDISRRRGFIFFIQP